MVKINPSVTLELRGGQKVTIELEEARDVIKGLAKFVQNGEYSNAKMVTSQLQQRRKRSKIVLKAKIPHMSDSKRTTILQHIEKRLSAEPRTISKLLKGTSYVPNHLPYIRRMIESQRNVAKKNIGKRTFYYRS